MNLKTANQSHAESNRQPSFPSSSNAGCSHNDLLAACRELRQTFLAQLARRRAQGPVVVLR